MSLSVAIRKTLSTTLKQHGNKPYSSSLVGIQRRNFGAALGYVSVYTKTATCMLSNNSNYLTNNNEMHSM